MFGTIGHFHPREGHEDQVRALFEDWVRTQRATIPGLVVGLTGRLVDRPGEIIEVVLMRDKATYQALAESDAQDAWYRQVVEHLTDEPTWEDVEWETFQADILSSPEP